MGLVTVSRFVPCLGVGLALLFGVAGCDYLFATACDDTADCSATLGDDFVCDAATRVCVEGTVVDLGPVDPPADLVFSYAGTDGTFDLAFVAPGRGEDRSEAVTGYELMVADPDEVIGASEFVAEQTLTSGVLAPGETQTWPGFSAPWHSGDKTVYLRATAGTAKSELVSATLSTDATLDTVPDAVEFGDIQPQLGVSATSQALVTLNAGALVSLPVTVEVYGDASQFAVPATVDVPPGPAGADLGLSYAPTKRGEHTAVVRLSSAVSADLEALVRVSGTGVNAAPTVPGGVHEVVGSNEVVFTIADDDGITAGMSATFTAWDDPDPTPLSIDIDAATATLAWPSNQMSVGVIEISDGIDVSRAYVALRPTGVHTVVANAGWLDDEGALLQDGSWLELGDSNYDLTLFPVVDNMVVFGTQPNRARLYCGDSGLGVTVPAGQTIFLINVEMNTCDGALIGEAESNLVLLGTLFEDNSGEEGTAVITAGGSVFSYADTFQNNDTGVGSGAAIRALAAPTSNVEVEIHGSTFTNNQHLGFDLPDFGGAIAMIDDDDGSSLTIADANFEGNVAPVGGALGTSGVAVSIERTTFTLNFADATGGAIEIQDGPVAGETVRVVDSTFVNNIIGTNTYGFGTALQTDGQVDLTLAGTRFVEHETPLLTSGVASVVAVTYAQGTTVNVDGCLFEDNGPAVARDEVGLHVRKVGSFANNGPTVSITNSVFSDNRLGPIRIEAIGDTVINVQGTVIDGNRTATSSSGLVTARANPPVGDDPVTTVVDSRITNNVVGDGGVDSSGGIAVEVGSLSIRRSTIADNMNLGPAAQAGGVLVNTTPTTDVTVDYSILWNNLAPDASVRLAHQLAANGGAISHSIVQDGDDTHVAGVTLVEVLTADPLFAPGGYLLRWPDSPGIDVGPAEAESEFLAPINKTATSLRAPDTGPIDLGHHQPTDP